ncbi:phage portal protein [Amphiplicatus metriothermophilus]|uniref:Phage portal protein, HK97 family n=1 Tax=Amphiplicatus metriothermophilus TaxID=1519374 RepID=A0A239PJT0_9PROT|nr:phage portal protein [Amphiplicatus metriothermophilus]MBB5518083.1 HK97 family phage portal protein [Amphiplicatus metriothermophilus]SNT67583.1 phage portal protein, HK97 family [Amphiplicatus metriothermophilus]
MRLSLADPFRALRPRAAEKKASAARPLIALAGPRAPVWTPRDYASLARAGFERNVVAYRCVRLVAEAAASAPLKIVEDGAVACDHPLKALLERPNPDQSGAELFEALYGFLQTAGNAYLEAAFLDGAARELYALRPDRMKARLGPRGWPDAYEYSVGGRKVLFRMDEGAIAPILHLKLFHPTNDHYGLSPLEAAAAPVDLHNAATAWNKALLDNAARPSGALVYKGPEGAESLAPEQFERLKAELAETYAGPAGAGRPIVLDGGLDWRQMSLSPADMDFMEAKNAAAREIALAFGVPPMLLGIPGDNTYSNYREANLAFWKQTVLPLVKKTAAALTGWLGRAFGARVECDLAGIEALAAERDALWARVSAADFLDEDEKRAMLGLAPRAGGEAGDV